MEQPELEPAGRDNDDDVDALADPYAILGIMKHAHHMTHWVTCVYGFFGYNSKLRPIPDKNNTIIMAIKSFLRIVMDAGTLS